MGRDRLPLFLAGEPLRGLAALAILGYHLVVFSPGPGPHGFPLQYGAGSDLAARAAQQLVIGLPVFFVLSGYLIGRPFVLALIEARPLPALGGYLRRRALRLLPAFWATVAVTALVFGISGTSMREVLLTLGLSQPLDPSPLSELVGQAWTLHVEAVFYLAVPVVAVALALLLAHRGPPARRALILAAVVGIAGTASLAVHVTGRLEPDHDALARFYAFVPGLALALAEPWSRRVEGSRRAARGAGLLVAGGALAIAAIVVATPQSRLVYELLTTLAAGCFVAAPLILQWAKGTSVRTLDNPLTRWLGSRSYSIYLVHVPVMAWLLPRLADEGAGGARWAAALACAALALVLADVSYRCVERPFLRRRRRPHPAEAPVAAGSRLPGASQPQETAV